MRRPASLPFALAAMAAGIIGAGGPKPQAHRAGPPKAHAASKPHAPSPPKPHASAPKPTPHHAAAPKASHGSASNGINPVGINAPGFGVATSHGYHQGSYGHPSHRHYGYYHPHYAMGYRNWNRTRNSPALQAQMRHLRQIQADLETIPRGASPDPRYGRKLDHDLMAAVMNPTRPDPIAVQQLSADVARALASRSHPTFNSGLLARDLMEVVNVGGLSSAEVRMAAVGAEGALHASGAGRAEGRAVVADLRMITTGGGAGGEPAPMIRPRRGGRSAVSSPPTRADGARRSAPTRGTAPCPRSPARSRRPRTPTASIPPWRWSASGSSRCPPRRGGRSTSGSP